MGVCFSWIGCRFQFHPWSYQTFVAFGQTLAVCCPRLAPLFGSILSKSCRALWLWERVVGLCLWHPEIFCRGTRKIDNCLPWMVWVWTCCRGLEGCKWCVGGGESLRSLVVLGWSIVFLLELAKFLKKCNSQIHVIYICKHDWMSSIGNARLT